MPTLSHFFTCNIGIVLLISFLYNRLLQSDLGFSRHNINTTCPLLHAKGPSNHCDAGPRQNNYIQYLDKWLLFSHTGVFMRIACIEVLTRGQETLAFSYGSNRAIETKPRAVCIYSKNDANVRYTATKKNSLSQRGIIQKIWSIHLWLLNKLSSLGLWGVTLCSNSNWCNCYLLGTWWHWHWPK